MKRTAERIRRTWCDYLPESHRDFPSDHKKALQFAFCGEEQGLVSTEPSDSLKVFHGEPPAAQLVKDFRRDELLQTWTADFSQRSGEASPPHWTPSRASICVGAIVPVVVEIFMTSVSSF